MASTTQDFPPTQPVPPPQVIYDFPKHNFKDIYNPVEFPVLIPDPNDPDKFIEATP